jgi:RHH-type proline utilization regulon transcriptional repressor/proline dehydrogenase/delta 1-pyrroline-5-carboxylate dehydrogenase
MEPVPMIFADPSPARDPRRRALAALKFADEETAVGRLLAEWTPSAEMTAEVQRLARRLVEAVRAAGTSGGGLDAFLQEYQLDSREGVVLMCLAEALLRIPDAETADRLIRDKIGGADWERHVGQSDSLLVNASAWALMLTGRVIRPSESGDLAGLLRRVVQRSGEPVIRSAVAAGMRILGRQFVMGRTIEEALSRARPAEREGYRHSYDMLGEGARTMADARKYAQSYERAIAAIGKAAEGRGPIEGPGISVKLSALHPRYELAQRARVMAELVPALTTLARQARGLGIGFTIDAEEADRLDISLDIVAMLAADPSLAGWDGLGLAVQAYQKRAPAVIDWAIELARGTRRRLMVRLVKGAYWDSEIKRAQERGLAGYPVYTRKAATDLSYLVCARRMLAAPDAIYAMFATHNAHTLATVMALAKGSRDFEFQRLHGMGEALYREVVGAGKLDRTCRVYAPVGGHEDLLAYLVRRLLENGANTSFVNRITDRDAPIEEIIADPAAKMQALPRKAHPRIPLPVGLHGAERPAARGTDLTDEAGLERLAGEMDGAAAQDWRLGALVGGAVPPRPARSVRDPADNDREIGTIVEATADDVEQALARASAAAFGWNETPAEARAACLDRAADAIEANTAELMALCVREAGKTLPDAVAELREAMDFCRYYAARARAEFAAPLTLRGPTGETNQIALHGRGVFACISPWNFPLAIFMGQVTAALAAGNSVIAKPAEQTPLIAARAVALLHQAGVPTDVLHLLPGDGATIGGALTRDNRVAGIAFTGSTETARLINRTLAGRDGPIVPLIAETGGQNAMVVDSSALPEQVVGDAIASAFQSAGQRCSALRVLFLQEDVAPRIIEMLTGAMDDLVVGDPGLLATDVGPVIDADALGMLESHAERMTREGRLLRRARLGAGTERGTFFAPTAFEIDSIGRLQREVFGPILHVVRWRASELDRVLDAIRQTGYGLTLGIHSRIEETQRRVAAALPVGNVYVNRNIIGAVVGVQPFGGEGLSGTGPKAGGPRYLHRFATERTLSVDTTAAGGNAALLSLEEGE